MKTFDNQCAQGDVFFCKVDVLPDNAKLVDGDGPVVVAHSETGHHHQFEDSASVMFFKTNDPMTSYVKINKPSKLEHMRGWDTHAPILFREGIYKIKRQRESVPEGWRIVQD